MLPLLGGLAARAGASTASSAAVTSAAQSGAISAGTTSGTRMLSAAQFASAGSHLAANKGTHQTAAPNESVPAAGDGLGWLRA
ncbi:hypothetical protein [Streptomyces sp. NPDC017260]|uniref:hypothetical protein n=1 Tax=unclassified Streptomyces TaxID=2593676 RepID=UPI0037A5B73B